MANGGTILSVSQERLRSGLTAWMLVIIRLGGLDSPLWNQLSMGAR